MRPEIDGTAIGRLKRTAGRKDRVVLHHEALRRLRTIRAWPPARESEEERITRDLFEQPLDPEEGET